jgi:formylglycine-generating enzyme required for sulfatase activity
VNQNREIEGKILLYFESNYHAMNVKLSFMKKILMPVIVMFLTIPVVAQNKTHTAPTHGKSTKQVAAKPEMETKLAEVVRSIESKMVSIQGGSFTMGCVNPQDSECYYWEKPRHTVSVSSYYLGKYPVTVKEWKAVMGTTPNSSKNCSECPMENITWYEAMEFISKLNQLTGKYYRLPTEAEWEYAAKGGNMSHGYKFPGSNDPKHVAWYDSISGGVSHPVGQKQPNELGLYDMGGNVWQWCSDWFDDKYYSNSPSNNPQGPSAGNNYRCVRGGSWWGPVIDCRSCNRDRYPPDAKDDDVGFRIARND